MELRSRAIRPPALSDGVKSAIRAKQQPALEPYVQNVIRKFDPVRVEDYPTVW